MTIRLRRSALYVPGSNPRAIAKAATLDADVIILDLEDAVLPDEKVRARQAVETAVRARAFGSREVVVRLNHATTRWGADDLTIIAAAAPSAILLPKVETSLDILNIARSLGDVGTAKDVRLWAMVETPAAVAEIGALAGAAADPVSRLDVLVMGLNDLARETRVRFVPGRAPMQAWLSACVLAARRHGLAIIDGVCNDLDDPSGLRAECVQARDFGFDGKSLLHPGQIGICNAAFSPTDADLSEAMAIVRAFDDPANAGRGTLRVGGRMVEVLHAEMARATLATAAAITARNHIETPNVRSGL
ncbi:HpcH/HpaI aldolase/citrate lyase family protein [Lichenihabitans psoromatis]|uniref:HpcH/HpaI aldolase/citrate lyase family protein n=1 Tax=Lichenihabitans psoromatis TaxID=2528642 RepID=UPI0010383833|nr:CoA ester lyase [Lichenihabitans psoromatis]